MSTPLGPCPQAQPACPLLPLPVPRCSLLTTPSPAAPSAGGDASSQPWTLSSSLHASNHHGIYSWRLDAPPPLTGVLTPQSSLRIPVATIHRLQRGVQDPSPTTTSSGPRAFLALLLKTPAALRPGPLLKSFLTGGSPHLPRGRIQEHCPSLPDRLLLGVLDPPPTPPIQPAAGRCGGSLNGRVVRGLPTLRAVTASEPKRPLGRIY